MILEKLKDLIADQLGIDKDIITSETYFSQLGADSLDIAEIILRIEEEFDLELSNEDVGKTIGSLVSYIDTNLGSELI